MTGHMFDSYSCNLSAALKHKHYILYFMMTLLSLFSLLIMLTLLEFMNYDVLMASQRITYAHRVLNSYTLTYGRYRLGTVGSASVSVSMCQCLSVSV